MCGSHQHRHHHHRMDRPAGLPSDDLRASDAERDAVVAQLREHAGSGRLRIEELDERIATALAAPTRRDLAALLGDLPRAPRPRDPARERRELRDHVRSYVAVMALLLVIWALTGAAYFWPIWPILGWGIGVVSHWMGVRGGGPRRHAARPGPA